MTEAGECLSRRHESQCDRREQREYCDQVVAKPSPGKHREGYAQERADGSLIP